MSVRIYELARRLKMSSKDLLGVLEKKDIPAKSHASTVDEDTAEALVQELSGGSAEKKKTAPKGSGKGQKAKSAKARQGGKSTVSEKEQAKSGKAGEKTKAGSSKGKKTETKAPEEDAKQTQLSKKKNLVNKPLPPSRKPAAVSDSGSRESMQTEATTTVAAAPGQKNKPLPKAPQVRPKPLPPVQPDGKGTPPSQSQTETQARIQVQGAILRTRPPIKVKDLAEAMDIKPFQLTQELMKSNIFATINETLEVEVAKEAAAKFGFTLEIERREKGQHKALPKQQIEEPEPTVEDKEEDLEARPPVVTFMGHVDHGKTSLLDAIRKANVVASEAGGITQHIGAYTVNVGGNQITFLDTPGHEAFTAMRARGAQVTDIAVLVVAADDGIMPQTREAINHAKAAGVAIVVAVNKVDKPSADPMRVRTELQELGLMPEDWGGETIVVDVSAITGQGLDDLLEMLVLQAEIMELKANPNRPAEGTVIEAQLEKGRGPTANILIRNGTLSVGDAVICGPYWGKVKALMDHTGQRVKKAEPSTAVKVLGISGVPDAGAFLQVVANDKTAREISEQRKEQDRVGDLERPRHVSLEQIYQQIKEEGRTKLNAVIKADVRGSVEAIVSSLEQIPDDKVKLEITHSGVGDITDSDVLLASASDALIIGFNVKADGSAKAKAKHDGVEIRLYKVIYELIEEVRKAMEGLLEPELHEEIVGHAEVRQVFRISRGVRTVAGSQVTDGRINKNNRIRVFRNGRLLHDDKISSLRHYSEDVQEVKAAQECGISVERFHDFEPGDILEAYTLQKVAQTL
jgi:translation initiation factor IF-2